MTFHGVETFPSLEAGGALTLLMFAAIKGPVLGSCPSDGYRRWSLHLGAGEELSCAPKDLTKST